MRGIFKSIASLLLFTLVFSSVANAQNEQTVHVVQPGDSLYGISVQYGVSMEDIEDWNNITNGVIHPGDELIVSTTSDDTTLSVEESSEEEADSDEDKSEEAGINDNPVPTIIPDVYPPEVHGHLQNILNQFSEFPIQIQVDMLDDDNRYARINKDLDFDNSPLGRVVVLAYTLNQVERDEISWEQEFDYTDDIETVSSDYPINMKGTSDSAFTRGSFTLTELVQGTLENDLNAFYLLLHHVGLDNAEDLNQFVSNTSEGAFTLDISTDEIHEYLNYIHNHNDQTISEIWSSIDSVERIIGSGEDTFLQLSAENDDVHYLNGIVNGETNYVITIISEQIETHGFDGIASRINDNHDVDAGPITYAASAESIEIIPVHHTVEYNETLEAIASNYHVTPHQLMTWNALENEEVEPDQELEILIPGYYADRHLIDAEISKVLEKYKDYPVYVHVESLENDRKSASLNETTFVFGASVPKIVLVAYVQTLVSDGDLNWEDTYQYDDEVYNDPFSYAWGGSGIMQYEDYRTNTYTLHELTEMTLKHSDNMASNMLLYFVARDDDERFTQFVKDTYQVSSYSLMVTAKQMSQVMKYIYELEEDTVKEMMSSTDYDGEKLDVVQDETYQKIGGTGSVNHSSAIVEGEHDYVITVLSSYASNDTISNIARDVNEVINIQQSSNH